MGEQRGDQPDSNSVPADSSERRRSDAFELTRARQAAECCSTAPPLFLAQITGVRHDF
jgi:hypothetical protein